MYTNALTIDIEDYFHVTAFESCLDNSKWNNYPLRVVDNTIKILDILDEFSIKGTFFVLGWVAERKPQLVRKISDRGHEVASHGYNHQRIYKTTSTQFREDIKRSKRILEDIIGSEVKGYRAPSYSITNESLWAFDILSEEGFTYDSSVFPIRHDLYGIPGSQRHPYVIETKSGSLKEFPLTTRYFSFLGRNIFSLPIAGGGYLRLFPIKFLEHLLRHINEAEQQPFIIYFHPWEIDFEQPRVGYASSRSRFRHYLNLDTTENKLRSLFNNFSFSSIKNIHFN